MNEISQEQRNLIKSFGGNKIKDPSDFTAFYNELFVFLSNKPKDESIDLELLDIWNNNKKYLESKNLPRGIRYSLDATKEIEIMLKNSEYFDNIKNIKIRNENENSFSFGGRCICSIQYPDSKFVTARVMETGQENRSRRS